ncbi:hypothetical protein HYS10_00385 [Candidatus Collierbacteria bacterium]|nr:hypothetical protein [Candidatus Collierbacteria bacterium]
MPPRDSVLSAINALQKRKEKLNQRLLSHKTARNFFNKSSLIAYDLRQKSTRLLAGVGLTGALLISPITSKISAPALVETPAPVRSMSDTLKQSLQSITPQTPTKLAPEQASKIEEAIYAATGLRAKAVLEDQSLNHQVGYIGYEQHLRRFPGDTLLEHDDEQIAGIAPGLGGWGYFARSRAEFTTQDYLREKWYSVAQTLYLPNWNRDFVKLRDWYKHRKILVINPANGTAVVTVLGDAGPANWTGKQFGGSPETMKALNLHLKSRKGLVLFLFLDDPDNLISLGPVTGSLNLPQAPTGK